MDRYDALVAKLEREYGLRIVRKDQSKLQRAIDRGLRIITFGRMRAYLTSYQTTIGRTVYVTADWDATDRDERYVTLRHEAIHLAQFRRYTLPVMALLYLVVPLPLGLAYFRARFEQEAYAETIRAAAEVWGAAVPRSSTYRAHVIEQFTGPSYGWMWPFHGALERWYDGVLASIG